MAAAAAASFSYSSTSLISKNKYDVFLSFGGKDTRDCFTSHLYSAFTRENIETFIDYRLTRGNEISHSLLDAIEASAISVVIFSESYASSSWCLDELLKILECKNNYGQTIIPVFYRVDPSDVRNQRGIFGDLFSKLQGGLDKKERWRKALTDVATLSGFDSHVLRPESKLVEEIANEVLELLGYKFQSENKDLVGVELHIKKIESLLGNRWIGVRKIGIWGIGGIGKTTIAGAVFDKISRQFEGSYFARNVREAEETGGIAHLRQELLCTLMNNDANLNLNIPNIRLDFQRKRLTRKKVLIVFDDVKNLEQIEFLIGSLDSFDFGSRIIITTRDKQVLRNCRVDQIYQVKELEHANALKLFSRCAFGRDYVDASYSELTEKVIKYAQGVPLALKVLGRFLSGRRKEEWESAIKKLEMVPHMEIQKVLKISYDGLDDKVQNIFLDIACLLVGEYRDEVISFMDACGFFGEIGLSILVDKALIAITNNTIRMHDLLKDMGREIVRQESINHPGRRSRLYHHKDIYDVLTKNTGTEAIEGISLDMSKLNEMHLNPITFTRMPELRFLKFYGKNKCKVSDFQDVGFTQLRYLHWQECPLKTLNIRAENLVSLILPGSKVRQLWDTVQNLVNLKEIDLSNSGQLMKLPDLSQAINLENLLLKGCSNLVETHSSIQNMNKLVILDMRLCERLMSLPSNLCKLKSLQRLHLSGCSNLRRIPESIVHLSKLERLHLKYCSKLRYLPELPCNLLSVGARGCTSLETLTSLSIMPSLRDQYINLSGCLKLDRNELRGVIEDSQLKLQLKANTWWLKTRVENLTKRLPVKMLRYLKQGYDELSSGIIYYPGSKIPRWFSFSSKGSSINLNDLPPYWFNSKLMGFAFCAIVAFGDHHADEDAVFHLHCRMKIVSGSSFSWYVRNINYVRSDHVFMGYYFYGMESESEISGMRSFEIYFSDNFGTILECCGVKKCGIHLLYAED